ncbi:ABC transporter permease [Actinokineospora enzanensis]|uniref:ABC transporter permease n=1 Tax=Actinokineospora enzanensis TaxID=155975 RepID=UPI0003787E82|nr:ABC transporter permease [Actinokineospora enzanensis]
MRVVAQAFRLQLAVFGTGIGRVAALVALPFQVLVLLSITRHGGRVDLDTHALLAPALIGMWTLGLGLAAGIVEGDRWDGVLEHVLVSRASFFRVLLGRSAAVSITGLVVFVEAWLVAVALGVRLEFGHPVLFVVGVLATCLAMAGAVLVLSTVFVLGREASSVRNSLTYPVYVLGGVFLPTGLLPDWLEPLSRLVFLSWSADLLRAATAAAPLNPWPALSALVVLGGGYLVVGAALTRAVVRRVREDGRVLVG